MSTLPDVTPNTGNFETALPVNSGIEHNDEGSSATAPDSIGRWDAGLDWSTIGWIALLHVGAVASLFCFTRAGLLTGAVLFWLTASVGICMGYHRLFAHRSFIYWHFVLGFSLFAVGWAAWDLQTGISLVMFGIFLRLTCVLHVTWLVNSASHIWG